MPPLGFEPTISAGERPQAARLLRSWVRIPTGAWIFVCCECRVLSSRGLCDGLITRPEESYRLCCDVVCDLETSRMVAPYIYDISHLRVKSAWASVQSTTGSRGVRISGSNVGCTMFPGSVKSTRYPLYSPVFPSLPLPCVTVCHHVSIGVYDFRRVLVKRFLWDFIFARVKIA